MVKYALECDAGHAFDGWFSSSDDYDTQQARGLVSCPVCDSPHVRKAIMAPRVTTSRHKAQAATELQRTIEAARQHIAQTFTYVGSGFADEVRAMHSGDAEERPVYGEASASEVASLLQEGLAIAPLPEVLSPRQPLKH